MRVADARTVARPGVLGSSVLAHRGAFFRSRNEKNLAQNEALCAENTQWGGHALSERSAPREEGIVSEKKDCDRHEDDVYVDGVLDDALVMVGRYVIREAVDDASFMRTAGEIMGVSRLD